MKVLLLSHLTNATTRKTKSFIRSMTVFQQNAKLTKNLVETSLNQNYSSI